MKTLENLLPDDDIIGIAYRYPGKSFKVAKGVVSHITEDNIECIFPAGFTDTCIVMLPLFDTEKDETKLEYSYNEDLDRCECYYFDKQLVLDELKSHEQTRKVKSLIKQIEAL